MSQKLSIVVPVYFNQESLVLLSEELGQVELELAELGVALEVVFVDDGSGDNSLDKLLVIQRNRENYTVVKLTRNFGVLAAVKVGLEYVTGDCFMFLAADLQDPPELIPKMVKEWLDGRKYVICERESRDDPWTSKALSTLYYKLLRIFVVDNYPAGGFDLMLLDSSMLPIIRDSSKSLHPQLLSFWIGLEPKILKYHRPRRLEGRSRWTLTKKVNAALDVFLGFSIRPIRLMSFLGIITSSSSFLYGSWVLLNALLGNIAEPGFASVVALLTFLLGLVIFMLGVLGEYLWKIFGELDKRPRAVVDEVFK